MQASRIQPKAARPAQGDGRTAAAGRGGASAAVSRFSKSTVQKIADKARSEAPHRWYVRKTSDAAVFQCV